MPNASAGSMAAPLLVFGGVLGLIYYLRWREVAAVRDGLRVAGADDARIRSVMFSGQVAEGTVRGRCVTYEVQAGSKSSPSHTLVSLRAPGNLAFEMHLSPQSRGTKRLVERGLEIDLIVGEPDFDDAVVVEAAPAATARAVLDANLRARILARMPCTLAVADGAIRFRTTGRLTSAIVVNELVELLRAIDARLEAAAILVASQQAEANAFGYRESGDAAVLRDARAERELAHLREVRREQARRRRITGLVFLIGTGVYLGAAFLFLQSRHRPAPSHAAHDSTQPASHSPTSKAVVTAPPQSTVVHAPVAPFHPKLPAGDVTPAIFCDTISGILGASRRAWCTASEQARPGTAHILQESDTQVASCKKSLSGSIAGGRVQFDPKAALACIEASYAVYFPPALDASEHLEAARVAACKQVFAGSVAQGDPCSGSLECKAGLTCAGTQRATVCQPPAAGGASCGIAIDILNPSSDGGLYQPWLGNTHLHDGCVAGFECNVLLNRCDPIGKKGDKCGLLTPCEANLACRFDVCTDERGGEEGEPCTRVKSDNDCRPGLACDAKTHTCGPRVVYIGLCQ